MSREEMTNEEAIEILKNWLDIGSDGMTEERLGYIEGWFHRSDKEAFELAIEALEQEPRKDEVILTKEEYGELVSSEFDNGYAKGYREALEQEPILDKIRAEIRHHSEHFINDDGEDCLALYEDDVMEIIDKYRKE